VSEEEYRHSAAAQIQRAQASTKHGFYAEWTHGAYRARSGIRRADRKTINRLEQAIAAALPWAQQSDAFAIRELAKLLLRAERVDGYLSRTGELTAEGDAKRLTIERRNLSQTIMAWCRELGLTPSARAALGVNVGRGRLLEYDLAAAMSEGGEEPRPDFGEGPAE
jgi:hypothetical protein